MSNQEKINNCEIADIFLNLYNKQLFTDYKIIECNDSPDVVCKDSNGNILNMELTRLEDVEGDSGYSERRIEQPTSRSFLESNGHYKVNLFDKDTFINLQKQINKKIMKDYGPNAILVIWQIRGAVSWKWKMELPDIKNKIINTLSLNPYTKGIWLLSNDLEIFRLDKV